MLTNLLKNRRWFCFWLGAASLLLCTLNARAESASRPQRGTIAPDFTLQTLDGKAVSLGNLVQPSPVVLLILRGWPGYQCPLCTDQVHRFVEAAAEFRQRGATVVMVYPGPADQLQAHAAEFLADKSWPTEFIFLVDPDYRATEAYGVRWAAEHETAYPSTFVIDRGGKILWSKVSTSHAGRTSPAEALTALP